MISEEPIFNKYFSYPVIMSGRSEYYFPFIYCGGDILNFACSRLLEFPFSNFKSRYVVIYSIFSYSLEKPSYILLLVGSFILK